MLQAQPGYGPSVINMAIAYQEKQENEAAEQLLRQFLRVYPNSPFGAWAREAAWDAELSRHPLADNCLYNNLLRR